MVNPVMRARRLRQDFEQLQKLQESKGLFSIEEASGDPPDRYVLRFTCCGVARVTSFPRVRERIEGWRAGSFLTKFVAREFSRFTELPVYSRCHRVSVALTESYPERNPRIEWLTPIFHPNIGEEQVCLIAWKPRSLNEVVFRLADLIQYKIYNTKSPLNGRAAHWARTHRFFLPVDRRPLQGPRRLLFNPFYEPDIDLIDKP